MKLLAVPESYGPETNLLAHVLKLEKIVSPLLIIDNADVCIYEKYRRAGYTEVIFIKKEIRLQFGMTV